MVVERNLFGRLDTGICANDLGLALGRDDAGLGVIDQLLCADRAALIARLNIALSGNGLVGIVADHNIRFEIEAVIA